MTLTDVSKNFRRYVKIIVIFGAVYYFATLYFFPGMKNLARRLIPDRDPPTPVFGVLEPLEFVEKRILTENPKYTLNTRNGRLPSDMPRKMPVYKFADQQFSYLAGKNALETASVLGFEDADLASDLKGTVYKWRKIATGAALEINIDNKDLLLDTNLTNRSQDFQSGALNENSAKQRTIEFFKNTKRLEDTQYSFENAKATLGRITIGGPVPINNSSEAQIARVDLFRTVNGVPVVGPDFSKGLMHAFVATPRNQQRTLNFPRVEAYYKEIIDQTPATYPIIYPDDAWEAVQAGRGIISSLIPKNANVFEDYKPVNVDNILIDNIYLAYYETPEPQKYLQPIYVFQGKFTARGSEGGDIAIYFPAITAEYVSAPTQQPTEDSNNTQN